MHRLALVTGLALLVSVGATAASLDGPGRAKDARATLSIYVPCGMTAPFYRALRAFRAANAGVRVDAVYDNDADLLRKVLDEGKRPDLFVSPGGRELAVLREKGLAAEDLPVRLGSFRIVAVMRAGTGAAVKRPQDLLRPEIRTIVLPDANLSSMGWHVRQALERLGVWRTIQPKLRPARRIIEAYESLLKGRADVTFTYLGCPLPKDPRELARSRVRIAFELPVDGADTPRVAIGVLKASRYPREASRLLAFLGSARVAREMIAAGLPDERAQVRQGVAARQAPVPRRAATSGGPVVVTGFFPDDERHREVRAFLRSLNRRFPGRVRVSLHDFKHPEADPEGFRRWQQAGFGCAGILVNGRNVFTLGRRHVTLQRKMGVQWTQSDLIQAIESELHRTRR